MKGELQEKGEWRRGEGWRKRASGKTREGSALRGAGRLILSSNTTLLSNPTLTTAHTVLYSDGHAFIANPSHLTFSLPNSTTLYSTVLPFFRLLVDTLETDYLSLDPGSGAQ